jgi:phage tail sheath protein FI
MSYEHGISSIENATASITPVKSESALSVIIGTAPFNLSADPSKATNVPKYVYDKASALAAVGFSTDFLKFSLCQSIFARFDLFNVGPVVLINVLDRTKHVTAVPSKVCAVILKQANVNEEGILLDTLIVKSADGATTYVKDTDYVASFNIDGTVLVSLTSDGAAAAAVSITASYSKLDPSKVTELDIIGGYDAITKKRSGLELINEIYPKFGVVPCQIIAPGWSQNPTVAAAMIAKSINISGLFNAVAITDLDTSVDGCQSFDEVKEYKESNGYTDNNNIPCWPKVKVGAYELFYSAVYDALIATTDNANDGPFKSPSNENYKISGTCLEGGEEINLTLDEANVINGAGVVTAINMNGFKTWGNEMGCYPGNTDVKDRYIVIRRLFNWWDNNFKLTFFSRVDDPANYRLIEDVCNTEDNMMKSYASSGKIAGGSMVFNESENPVENIIGGTIVFHRTLAGYTPAKMIKTVTEFDPTLILTALQGGE